MNIVPVSRHVCFWCIVVCGCAWDLTSKWSVFRELGYRNGQIDPWLQYDGKDVFYLHTTFNQGALWGMGQGLGWLFAIVGLSAILGICYWLFVRGAARSWWLTVTLAFVMVGTLGNLYDRLYLHGCVNPATGEPLHGVRDFMQMNLPLGSFTSLNDFHWATYNFADVFLVAGAIMLFLQSFTASVTADDAEKSSASNKTVTAS
mgnify:FL=1